MARSLGLFAGVPAKAWSRSFSNDFGAGPERAGPLGVSDAGSGSLRAGAVAGLGLAFLDSPRPVPGQRARGGGWEPEPCPDGSRAVFHGWFDNLAEIAGQLGLAPGASVARVYGEAVARWGDAADSRIVGTYAAVVAGPDGLRLSRSPWSAPALFYANDDARAMAASALRALAAGGMERVLNRAALAAMVSFCTEWDDQTFYEGARMVPHGAVVHLRPGAARVVNWYDPQAIPEVRFSRDEDYVAAAREQLDAVIAATLPYARRPGIALSGGLDSAIVAAHVLRQLAPGQTLPSFTFTPHPDWDGSTPPGTFGDERAAVEAFAAMHPELRPHFPDDSDAGYDEAARQFAQAMDGFHRHLHLAAPYQGVWRAAREAGCDLLLTADWGNGNISSDAPWAPVEFLRTGEWEQLVALLRGKRGDTRPLWRRLLARAVLPQLPRPLRRAARRFVHGDASRVTADTRLARPEVMERYGVGPWAGTRLPIDYFESPRTRAENVLCQYEWARVDSGEALTAYEQVHGIRGRDITAYRPLIELCLGMPAGQFARDGVDRWLARRMGAGLMPEAQRTNNLYGRHHADWHVRMTPRRERMREDALRLAEHPWLGEWFDTERMLKLIDDWPAETTFDEAIAVPRRYALPLVLNAGDFVNWFEGRNA